MPAKTVEFHFLTGLKRQIFRKPRLVGSWDASGRYSDHWSEIADAGGTGEDGCPMFRDRSRWTSRISANVQVGRRSRRALGVELLGHPDRSSGRQFHRAPPGVSTAPGGGTQVERYYFTHCRRLGANKRFLLAGGADGCVCRLGAERRAVEVVFGTDSGYIADDGTGIDPAHAGGVALRSSPDGDLGRRSAGVSTSSRAGRTCIASKTRRQRPSIGRTSFPAARRERAASTRASGWPGTVETLDGTVSCSVVIDPDVVRERSYPRRPERNPT